MHSLIFFFFSSRRRHTRCALVTGVQTCALPISLPEGVVLVSAAKQAKAALRLSMPAIVPVRRYAPTNASIQSTRSRPPPSLLNVVIARLSGGSRHETRHYCNARHLGLRRAGSVALCAADRSEEHTSELQSLMRISY